MRTATKLTSAVVAAALLFGLTGMASVANAAAPTAATITETTSAPGDDQVNTQGTRQFTITNFSGHTLTIKDIWGTSGWPYPKKTGFDPYDEFPLAGSVLKPGQQMTFEIRDWSDHGITVKFGADNGKDAFVYLHVSGVSRYSDAQGLEGQFVKGGGDVTILDKPGTIAIPAGDPAAQSQTMNSLCGQAGVECKFEPKEKKDGLLGPAHPFGRGVANMTPRDQTTRITEGDTVETSSSLEIGASVKATIFGAVETGLTTTYKTEWKASHTFSQQEDLNVGPGEVAWLSAQEPIVRVTGDLKITMKGSQTTWLLQGVAFDVPDQHSVTARGGVNKFARAMTDDEVKEAWLTGGFVDSPWKRGPEGVTVETLHSPEGDFTGTAGASVDLDGFTVPA
jgi:hypothetical protein